MIFHDLTLNLDGTLRSHRREDTAGFLAAAVEVFRSIFDAQEESAWTLALPVRGLEHLELRWTSEVHGSGLATFYSRGEVATVSALVSGSDLAGDTQVLRAFQDMLNQMLRPRGMEPGFDALNLSDRPAILTLPIPSPGALADIAVIADAERCLAAGYFLTVLEPDL